MQILQMVCFTVMRSLENYEFLAQAQPSQTTGSLINFSGQHLIYVGVGLLAIAVVVVLGLINRRFDLALLVSLLIAAVIIALVILA